MTVMGRSFHWMDRPATLKALDSITASDGCVVLFGDRHISSTPEWRDAVNGLAETFAPARNADRERRKGPTGRRTKPCCCNRRSTISNASASSGSGQLTADDIVGRAFSTSVTSPETLGDRADAFEAELRAALARLSPDGHFSEIVEITGLIARRSSPSKP
jgi:hypothetical protein